MAWLEAFAERRRNNNMRATRGKIHIKLINNPTAALLPAEETSPKSTFFSLSLLINSVFCSRRRTCKGRVFGFCPTK